jgi:hypothetical protein
MVKTQQIEFRKYLSYNWFDIVHKNSSRGFPVPSPVPASTHEHLDPPLLVYIESSNIATSRFPLTHLRNHPTMVARDNLKLHSSPSLPLAGVCRIP